MVLKVEGGQTTGFIDQGGKLDHRKSWRGRKDFFLLGSTQQQKKTRILGLF